MNIFLINSKQSDTDQAIIVLTNKDAIHCIWTWDKGFGAFGAVVSINEAVEQTVLQKGSQVIGP